jgi:hypothetical protein
MDWKPLGRSKQAATNPTGLDLTTRSGPPLCGDIDIRIGRDGTWFYHGSPIGRKPLVKLFAAVIDRDETGGYWLVTPAERARIAVADAPFVAVEMTVLGEGREQRLRFRSNLDDEVEAGPEHPIRVAIDHAGEPSPYVLLRPGIEALIARSVYYQLADLAVEDADTHMYGVWSGRRFFFLGKGGEEA